MKKIAIAGAGGLAKEIYCILKDINKRKISWEFIGFIDTSNIGKEIIDGYKSIGDDKYVVSNLPGISIIIGVGKPSLREKIFYFYKSSDNFDFPNIIHPSVIGDFENIQIKDGNIIAGNTILSTNIHIGKCNVLNVSTTISHDVFISDFCVINPGANISGNVAIENNCLIGSNSVIYQGITLREGTILGLGSSLICSTVPGSMYLGNPAKKVS